MKSNSSRLSNLPVGLAIIFGFIGALMVLYATTWGAALMDDSYYYIKPARDLLTGVPMTLSSHYPPALPILLAGIGLTGIDPLDGVRYLNALIFGVNIFLSFVLVRQASGRAWAGVAAAVLVTLAQPTFEIHAWAMAEGLFITLTLTTFLVVARYLRAPRPAWLVTGALLAGLSMLTRYAGSATIGTTALIILLYPGRPWKRRLLDALLFGALAAGLFALYPLSMASVSHEFEKFGGLRFNGFDVNDLRAMFYNTLLWLAPGRLLRGREEYILAGIVALIAATLAALLVLRRQALLAWLRRVWSSPIPALLVVFAGSSLFLLYQSHLSPQYSSPYDSRLLAPTHLALVLLVVILIALAWDGIGRWLRGLSLVVLVVLLGLYAQRSYETAQLYHETGMGFAARYWHESDLIDFTRGLDADTTLVTTAPYGMYFVTGYKTELFNAYSPEELAAYLRDKGGYFILVESMPMAMFGSDEQPYTSKLVLVKTLSNARVYRAP